MRKLNLTGVLFISNINRFIIIYINFESLINKIITYTSIDECVGVIFDELVHKEFTESLWYCGHQIGEVTGVLKMDQMPFFSQMKIGVLNNNGVSYVSKSFSSID